MFLCQAGNFVNQELALGMAATLRKQGVFFISVRLPGESVEELRDTVRHIAPDGVALNSFLSGAMLNWLLRRQLPCVTLLDFGGHVPLPYLEINFPATGRMAAKYFLSKGFQNFAFVCYAWAPGFRACGEAFAVALKGKDRDCHMFLADDPAGSLDGDRNCRPPHSLTAWLKALPKPCALLAGYDAIAAVIIEQCLENGIRVPRDISVLGSNNNIHRCLLSSPEISSIVQPYRAIGAAAAELLLAQVNGQPRTRQVRQFDPIDIAERGSTRLVAAEDPLVERALEFIARNVDRPFRIGELRRLTGLSATGLTVRFNAVLGRTPIMEVRAQRIARAKQLLRDTDWSTSEIARHSCFNSVSHFYHAFKEFCGVSPLQFRRQARGG